MRKWNIVLLVVSLSFYVVGRLFLIAHWPYGRLIFTIGLIGSIATFLFIFIQLFLKYKKGQK